MQALLRSSKALVPKTVKAPYVSHYSTSPSHTKFPRINRKWTRNPHEESGSDHLNVLQDLAAKASSRARPAQARPARPTHSPSTSSPSITSSTTSISSTLVAPEIIAHKAAMKRSFPAGWNPPKKLSREAMEGLRALHGHDPETFTTAALATRFKISPEAVRRILRSKWKPDARRLEKMAQKEAEGRRAMIEGRKAANQAAKRLTQPTAGHSVHASAIPEMFMDEDSDRLLK